MRDLLRSGSHPSPWGRFPFVDPSPGASPDGSYRTHNRCRQSCTVAFPLSVRLAGRPDLPMCALVVVMRMIGLRPDRLDVVRGRVYWIAFAHQPSGARSTRSHRGA